MMYIRLLRMSFGAIPAHWIRTEGSVARPNLVPSSAFKSDGTYQRLHVYKCLAGVVIKHLDCALSYITLLLPEGSFPKDASVEFNGKVRPEDRKVQHRGTFVFLFDSILLA